MFWKKVVALWFNSTSSSLHKPQTTNFRTSAYTLIFEGAKGAFLDIWLIKGSILRVRNTNKLVEAARKIGTGGDENQITYFPHLI
jgi:hypothetical protein